MQIKLWLSEYTKWIMFALSTIASQQIERLILFCGLSCRLSTFDINTTLKFVPLAHMLYLLIDIRVCCLQIQENYIRVPKWSVCEWWLSYEMRTIRNMKRGVGMQFACKTIIKSYVKANHFDINIITILWTVQRSETIQKKNNKSNKRTIHIFYACNLIYTPFHIAWRFALGPFPFQFLSISFQSANELQTMSWLFQTEKSIDDDIKAPKVSGPQDA